MASRPKKRQRANTNEESSSASATDGIRVMIKALDRKDMEEILFLEALSFGSPITQAIINAYEAKMSAETTRFIDFDFLSKRVWHALQQGTKVGGSKQYELGLEAALTIKEAVNRIREQTLPSSSFGTKNSALKTLVKIGKSLVATAGRYGHVWQGSCQIFEVGEQPAGAGNVGYLGKDDMGRARDDEAGL